MPNIPFPPPSGQPHPWSGKVAGFGNALGNNSNMLLALGFGLLDKRQNNAVPFSQIGQQAMLGSQFDQERRESDEKREAKNMTVDWLVSQKGLSRQDAHAAVGNPVILASYFKEKSPYTAVGADSSLFNEETGEFLQPPGGGIGRPTDDMREYQQSVEQGFPGTFLDYQIKMREAGRNTTTVNTGDFKVPPGYQARSPDDPRGPGVDTIEGGPAEQMPAELAARIGMADSFLEQAPSIKAELEAGAATGVWDRARAGVDSSSEQASVLRKMKSGTDALQRMLTGAGMPISEAAQYAERYLPTYTDNAESAAEKLDQLTRELQSMKDMAMRGRGESGDGAPPAGADLYDKYGLER